MNKFYLSIAVIALATFSTTAFSQQEKKQKTPPISSTAVLERALYLNQIKAAEALLQLNEIAEAKETLLATNPKSRGLEWTLLHAMSDRSQATLTAHRGSVAGMAISADGNWIASGSADSTIILWDAQSLKPLATLAGHKGQVSTLDFSPDGKLLATGSTDKSIKIWQVATRKEIVAFTEQFSQGIYQLRFSPDGRQLAACSWELVKDKPSPVQGFTKILNVESGEVITRLDQDTHPSATLDYSPDGKKLVVASWGFIMYYYDLATGKLEWTYDLTKNDEYTAMNSADISPDGKTIVLGTKDNRIRVIDADMGKLRYQLDPWVGHDKWVNAVSFSPDGKLFASGADDQLLMVWETSTGKRVNTFRGHVGQIKALRWHPDGTRILTASQDATIKVWNINDPGELSFDVCENGPWYAPVTKDGKWMAAACSDNQINVWDLRNGKLVKSFLDKSANCAAFSADGKYLVAAGHDEKIYILDTETEKERFALEGHTKSIYGINFLNDQNLVVSVSADKTLRVWQVADGKEAKKIEMTEAAPYSVIFTPDQKTMIVGLTNGLVKSYSTDTWTLKNSFQAGTSINFMDMHRDGKTIIAGGSGGQLALFEWTSGKILHTLKGHKASVYALGFHPDGKYAVSGSYDRTVRLWDVNTGECTLVLRGFKDEIFTVSFFDAGRKLLITETEGSTHAIEIEKVKK